MRKELLEGLTEEQIAKAKACKNVEEIIAVAKEEGIELNDEQLAAVSGGGCDSGSGLKCPECGSHDIKNVPSKNVMGIAVYTYKCKKCGHMWVEI